MDLRDSHLEKALQHAPDRELAPDAYVRENVLAYAKNAAKPANAGWLAKLLQSLRQWHVTSAQLAGMGSVAVVLLVMLMVREQRPQESDWAPPVRPAPVAKADKAPKRAKVAESASVAISVQDAAREDEISVAGEAQPATEMLAKSAEKVEEANVQAESPAVEIAPMTAPLPQSTDSVAAAAPAERRAKSTLEPLDQEEDAAEAVAGSAESDLQYDLMTQGGKAVAERDIQAGELRLLSIPVSVYYGGDVNQ